MVVTINEPSLLSKGATMTEKNYRPHVGETLFVSLYNNIPFLVTITGFMHDPRFSSEQFTYLAKDGRKSFSSLNEAVFYPSVPADAPYIYLVEAEEHEFMEKSSFHELGFFFDPASAFDYIDAITAGTVKPRFEIISEFFEYSVRVQKL